MYCLSDQGITIVYGIHVWSIENIDNIFVKNKWRHVWNVKWHFDFLTNIYIVIWTWLRYWQAISSQWQLYLVWGFSVASCWNPTCFGSYFLSRICRHIIFMFPAFMYNLGIIHKLTLCCVFISCPYHTFLSLKYDFISNRNERRFIDTVVM